MRFGWTRGTCWCSWRAFWLAERRLNVDPVGTETCTSSNCLGLIKPTRPPAASQPASFALWLRSKDSEQKPWIVANLIAEAKTCRDVKSAQHHRSKWHESICILAIFYHYYRAYSTIHVLIYLLTQLSLLKRREKNIDAGKFDTNLSRRK